jgi:ribonuclease HI
VTGPRRGGPPEQPPGAGRILHVFTDGASRGNPGPAAIGVVILDEAGASVEEWGEYLGSTTNNVAEYSALLSAVKRLAALRPARVLFHLDSELIVRQLSGQYRVRDAKMKRLHEEVRVRLTALSDYSFQHVGRERNARADLLANEAIDRAQAGPAAS